MNIDINTVGAIIFALIWLGLFGFSLYWISRLIIRFQKKNLKKIVNESIQESKDSEIDKRRLKFINNNLKTFYYRDLSWINDLYTQIEKQSLPKEIQTRIQEEVSAQVGTKLVLNTDMQGKGIKEIISKYPEPHISGLYNAIEKYILTTNQVILDVENFDFNSPILESFLRQKEEINKLNKNAISEEVADLFIYGKKHESAMLKLTQLKSLTGYILFEGEFETVKANSETILSFTHPISGFLDDKNTKVFIRIKCVNDYILPSGDNIKNLNNKIKITCLGKVIAFNTSEPVSCKLEVKPIAIY